MTDTFQPHEMKASSALCALKQVLRDMYDEGHKVVRGIHYNGRVNGRASWRAVTKCPETGLCIEWVVESK